MRKRLAPFLLITLLAAAVAAQEAGKQTHAASEPSRADASNEVFRQLLQHPAPPPYGSGFYGEEPSKDTRPREFYDDNKQPPDDAPIEDLIAYWAHWAKSPHFEEPKMNDAVRRRILDACEADPSMLSGFTFALPEDAQTAERVKKLYDAAQGSEAFDDTWRTSVHEWLKFHSRYFSSELFEEARDAADKGGSYVVNETSLKALAAFDWEKAEPLLTSLSNGGQPRTAVLALALMRRHALEAKETDAEERLRARLQTVASDRDAPALARFTAVEELTTTEWTGRDDWYLSLFADESLLHPTDGSVLFHPLTTLFDRDPDKWIPLMTKLVESKDAAVRHNAAFCLAYHAMYHPRRDAILPVLPWLYDPEWIPIHSSEYGSFVGRLDKADVPESVPGLIWFIEHNENDARWIASTLGHYKDPRAIPVLRKALAHERSEDGRRNILLGLETCGGLAEDEQLAGLDAYVAKLDSEGGNKDDLRSRFSDDADNSLPIPVSIGHYLALKNEVSDSLVRAALARAEALRKKSPTRARLMLGVIESWQTKQVELDILRRIGAGTADADTIANALERRVKFRESVKPELYLLASGGGAPQGVAAVMLEDEALARSILESKDAAARLALLACARLVQMPLAVAQVGALLPSKDATLALASERYLLVEDSAEARALLWARHTGEAFVTGWRENVPVIGGEDFSAMGRVEEKLRAELYAKEDAPLEIFALMGNEGRPWQVLRVYASHAVYTDYEDGSRYRERVVKPEEVARFKDYLATNNLLDSGPRFGPCHYDCWLAEFFSIRREGGRRLFNHGGGGDSFVLTNSFDAFESEGASIHYNLEDELKGFEILFADESLAVEDVWQKDKDLRVRVRRYVTPEEEQQERRETAEENEENEEDGEKAALARARRRRRERERDRERISWRAFATGKLGANVARPEGYSTLDAAALDVDEEEFSSSLNANLACVPSGDYCMLTGHGDVGGFWKKSPGQKAVRVGGDGWYADPLVTPDGAWVVAARAGTNWAQPNNVVRFDLKTGREYRVNVPPATQFAPIAYVAAHGKILLRRARDEGDTRESSGPVVPEFYLLDAATGSTQQVKGVFEPLMQEGERTLQPSGRPDEFWAAIPDRAKNETRVGLYNVRDFSFRTLLIVPHLTFDSFEMWADEAASKLFVIYGGHLLRMPLQNSSRRSAG